MKPQDAYREVRELMEQYRAEVPGPRPRRAWPEAVKSRVRAISASGVPLSDIAKATGLAYCTIISWVPKSAARSYRRRGGRTGHFNEVAVVAAKQIATVAVKEPALPPLQITTVTVTLAGGIEVKGVTPEFLSAWLGKLGV